MQDQRFNSFIQNKGLMWYNKYQNILNWEEGKEPLLPPVGVTIDLTTTCNLRCRNCIAWRSWALRKTLTKDEVFKMIDMLVEWREEYKNNPNILKSICFAGGGEGSIHPQYDEIITYAHSKGFQVGISMNGLTLMNKNIRKALIENAEFCGISMDAGTREVWCDYKQVNEQNWDVLMKGIELLIKERKDYKGKRVRKLDLVYKYLITSYNQKDIFNACKLAHELGFSSFYARPAALEGLEFYDKDNPDWNVKTINEEIKKCKEYGEENDFNVFTNFLRVNKKTYGLQNQFKKCHASPLILQICADGNLYTCLDHRYQDKFKNCRWEKIKDYWGSDEHRKHVKKIRVKNCIRCCYGVYNQQIERCVINDDLYRGFP